MLSQTRYLAAVAILMAGLAGPLTAQSTDEVKLDVLSALSTPLPITIVGPLMARDVEVTQDGSVFSATLKDSALLGLFPIGDVTLALEPMVGGNYRISDLGLAPVLDFPGMGRLEIGRVEIDGIWSKVNRSYSDLHWQLSNLTFTPAQPGAGVLKMASLSFDVMTEPEETDRESRLRIGATGINAKGMAPQDIEIGAVEARLAANGDQPVDLYSVLREVIMRSGARDGGMGLRNLGASLLGNSYGVASLELAAAEVKLADRERPETSYFRAGQMELSATLTDVAPREWGGAGVALRLRDVHQQNMIDEGVLSVDEGEITLSGANLPVADMYAMVQILDGGAYYGQPVPVSAILDGVANFGKLELATEGRGISVNLVDHRYVSVAGSETRKRVVETLFDTGYDRWTVRFGAEGLNRNEGKVYAVMDGDGGRFEPGPLFPEEFVPHVNAWFPKALRMGSEAKKLNEALLKQLFRDVEIANLMEPVELIAPIALYVSAVVPEFASDGGYYETALFRVDQSFDYRLYPTEIFSLLPYEGQSTLRLKGFDGLISYFDKTRETLSTWSDEAAAIGAVKSGLIVLRNLAKPGDDGTLEWQVAKPDVRRPELVVNGVTFRYPELTSMLPSLMSLVMGL